MLTTKPPKPLHCNLFDKGSLCQRNSSRGGTRFSAPVQTNLGARIASCTLGTDSFPGVQRPRLGDHHLPTSSTYVKETVELYLYTLCNFMAGYRVNITLTLVRRLPVMST
jgi:hypothetical protein